MANFLWHYFLVVNFTERNEGGGGGLESPRWQRPFWKSILIERLFRNGFTASRKPSVRKLVMRLMSDVKGTPLSITGASPSTPPPLYAAPKSAAPTSTSLSLQGKANEESFISRRFLISRKSLGLRRSKFTRNQKGPLKGRSRNVSWWSREIKFEPEGEGSGEREEGMTEALKIHHTSSFRCFPVVISN